MRKILTFPRSGFAALKKAARSTSLLAVGASLAVTLCLSGAARGQSFAQQLVPTALSMPETPVSAAVAQGLNDLPTVDASYTSIMTDNTAVQPAQYVNGAGAMGAFASPCNPGCDVSWYGSYEALFLRREGDRRFTTSFGNFMPDFDYQFGSRITVGRLLDCTNGWEVSYAGPFDWQRQSSVAAAGTLQSLLAPSGGYGAAQVTAFNNANVHTQAYRAQMHSFEANRTWSVWDVVSTFVGMRFVDYEEDFLFISTGAAGTGVLREGVDNQLLGAQIGAQVWYPVSLRANVGFRGKGGVYANFADRVTTMTNAGATILNSGDSDVDVAGLIELGWFGNYQIVPSIRLMAGYEFWYLPEIATIAEQRPTVITPTSGTVVNQGDDLFLHGASFGVQVLF